MGCRLPLVTNILMLLLTNLCTVYADVEQNKLSLDSSTVISTLDQLCLVKDDMMCTSTFWNKFGSMPDFIAFWRTLRRRKQNHSQRLFTIAKKCNENIKGTMKIVLKAFGFGKEGGGAVDVLLNVKKMKRILRCPNLSANLSAAINRRRRNSVINNSGSTVCWPFWRGDGYCDLGCNTAEYDYDDGDCCYETCTKKVRRYPCGFTGFQCKQKVKDSPSWFKDVKFCFKWRPNGDGSQCDNAGRGKICAPVGSMTRFYYDDTDQRNGGCLLSWQIEARAAPSWFWTRFQLCMYTYADGDVFQCNYGNNLATCKRANHWLHYVDDTDNRPGGCILRWKALYLGVLPQWMANARFCFYWRSTGGQCGMPGQPRQSDYHCVPINSWTTQYKDDTDARNYGCEMAWGLLL